ncbi:hypothetical protein AKJ39_02810 [candidate division MSBL1 archaeon SCGC-AAA259J03]|uniref:Uncharacterized protein n=1 Tax=candidate division MSBL1 archaeon SCGC-AAA259J03 TaxID=1698269 RepID=A0A656YW22_9EURY|nr:hypothetical protein AKJ39_02810 [candidate division MSBL1 archaeon SCGC-AAA259J03]
MVTYGFSQVKFLATVGSKWFGRMVLADSSLRAMVGGIPDARNHKDFMWYGWRDLSKGKTLAEAWLANHAVYVDYQIIYGDPTFHY